MVATSLNALLELQKVDLKIRGLKEELREKPKLLESRQAEVGRLQEHVAKLNEDIKNRRRICKSQELEIEVRKEKIRKEMTKQNAAKTNEEYSACSNAMEKYREEISEIETQILMEMEAIDEAEEKLAEKQRDVAREQDKLNRFGAQVEEELTRLNAEIEELKAKRKERAGEVSKELLKHYLKIRKRTQGQALAPVVNRICQGCHVLITPNDEVMIHKGEKVITCKQCARILYLP